MASESRRLRRPFTTSRRSKWRVPAASASSTGLMPQMRFMACGLRSLSRAAAVARAAMPSPRPRAPRWSVLLAFTETAPVRPRASRRWRRASARGGAARAGAWAMTVTSTFTSEYPAASTSRRTSSRKTRLATPRQRGSLLGKCRPMSPAAAAPSSASHTACRTQSPSEWPSRPRSWGTSTPPSQERAAGHQAVGVEAVADADGAHARDRAPRGRPRPRPGPPAS